MNVKLFILGLPGSGKSTISRYINKYIKQQYPGWSMLRINDYDILYNMFLTDTEGKFTPTDVKGFDVRDLSVFDVVLREVEKKARRHIEEYPSPEQKLILMEFARNDYIGSFKQFNSYFLQDASFLFLNADINICKKRIIDRIANPKTEDDHFVSGYIFETYYNDTDKDDGLHLSTYLQTENAINDQKIKVIENNGAYEDILDEINRFIDFILKQKDDELVAANS